MKKHGCLKTLLIVLLVMTVLAAALVCVFSDRIRPLLNMAQEIINEEKLMGDIRIPIYLSVPANKYDTECFYTDGSFRRYSSEDLTAMTGIDVSSHQGEIDWELVAASGVEFAMLRTGYRGYTEGTITPDSRFEENLSGALAAGLKVGVYFFSQAVSEEEAIEEAEFVLGCIAGHDISLPVVFDWEEIANADARTDSVSNDTLDRLALAFCRRVEEDGYQPMIYFNKELGYFGYDLREIMEYPFWVADYSEIPVFYYDFAMWQYSASGSVDGIEGNTDLNIFFGVPQT